MPFRLSQFHGWKSRDKRHDQANVKTRKGERAVTLFLAINFGNETNVKYCKK